MIERQRRAPVAFALAASKTRRGCLRRLTFARMSRSMSPQRNTPSPALDSDIVEPDSGARRRPPRRARAGLRAETRVPYFTSFRAEKLVPLDTKKSATFSG